jgi:subtilisin family serine protease
LLLGALETGGVPERCRLRKITICFEEVIMQFGSRLTAFVAASLSAGLVACSDSPVEPAKPGSTASNQLLHDRLSPDPTRFIVILKRGSLSSAAVDALATRSSDKVYHVFHDALLGFAAKLSPNAVDALRQNPNVAYIEQDMPAYSHDPDYNAGWGLGRIDQRDGPSDYVFTSDKTGAGVNIYIVDSGIQTSHQDFDGRAHGMWTWDGNYPPNQDCNGHGTAVASVAGGREYGVAKQATLWSVRINDCDTWSWVSTIVSGIDWVAGHHIKPAVMNLSYGVNNWVDDLAPGSMNDAVKNTKNRGVFVVVSAGNQNAEACNYSPANAMEVMTVGATNINDGRASFSNFGGCVDVYAPGDNVQVATLGGSYGPADGTSFAAPFVAGVGALLYQTFPTDTPDQIHYTIRDGATQLWFGSLLYSSLPVPVYSRIEGPSTVGSQDQYCFWFGAVYGGRGPFIYRWSGALSGDSNWIQGQITESGPLIYEVWDSQGGYYMNGVYVTVDTEGNYYCGV